MGEADAESEIVLVCDGVRPNLRLVVDESDAERVAVGVDVELGVVDEDSDVEPVSDAVGVREDVPVRVGVRDAV